MTASACALSVCIINFNGAHHLPATLDAISALAALPAEVIVVDDASSDASIELVRQLCPAARLLRLPANRGPAAARNAAFSAARADRVLFLDNDIRITPGAVHALLAMLDQRPAALLVAPRVLYETTPSLIQYESADCHFLGLMMPRNAERRVTDTTPLPTTTHSLITACFLIDRRRWSGGQLFDEDFGFNLEDHDFGVRARLTGHELWVDPSISVLHGDGSAGLSYRPGGTPSAHRVFYLVRNRWFVIGKSFSRRTILLLAPALVLFELAQLAALASSGMAGPWRRALRSFRQSWPALRQKRREVQATRRVRDSAFLVEGELPFTQWLRGDPARRAAIRLLRGTVDLNWRLVRHLL